MITNNQCTEIGDVLLFSFEQPVLGVVTLTFTDTIVGETAFRYFDKQFRYSVDGIVYSQWMQLTNPNLATINLNNISELVMDFQYTRTGIDNTGILQFVEISFNGTSFPLEQDAPVALNSIIKDLFFNNIDVYNLCINLTQKMYASGIVPEYIIRGEKQSDFEEDKDYIAFWKSTAAFFSIYFVFAKRFTNIFYDRELLTEYIKEKNLRFCHLDQIYDLQLLIGRFYNEIRKRGTIIPFRQKRYVLADLTETDIDGEFLRMICYDPTVDEYLFNLVRQELGGWTVNRASPLFRGLHQHVQVNKSPENTEDFVDLTKYDFSNQSSGIYAIAADGDKQVLVMKGVLLGETMGLSLLQNSICDYEYSFTLPYPFSDLLYVAITQNGVLTSPFGPLYSQGWLDNFFSSLAFTQVSNTNFTINSPIAYGDLVFYLDVYSYDFDIDWTYSGFTAPITITITLNGTLQAPVVCANQGDVDTYFSGLGFSKFTDTRYKIFATTDIYGIVSIISGSSSITFNPIQDNPLYDHTLETAVSPSVSGCTPFYSEKAIIVDPNLTYEITFWFKQTISDPVVHFGAWGYDEYNNPIDFHDVNGMVTNSFFSVTKSINVGEYTFVRGIIYGRNTLLGYNQIFGSNSFGKHLQFPSALVRKIKIVLGITPLLADQDGITYFWNLKMRPIETPWSTGFIRLKNFIEIWQANKSGIYTQQELDDFIRWYLIPYDTTFKTIDLVPYSRSRDVAVITTGH